MKLHDLVNMTLVNIFVDAEVLAVSLTCRLNVRKLTPPTTYKYGNSQVDTAT
jgi:hypothetical protein